MGSWLPVVTSSSLRHVPANVESALPQQVLRREEMAES
jgi:hypothetical protein